MYMKDLHSGDLVEILNFKDLVDPCIGKILGRFHVGEELQEATPFSKSELLFPSGESIPRCWIDPNYKGHLH